MRCFLALPVFALAASPAHANEDDFNIWTGQFISVDVSEDVYIRGEVQERFTNDADRLGQLLLRGFVGYRFNKRVNLGGGYAYILTDPVGPIEVNEHRFYQELNIRLIDKGGVTLDSRTRLEQRTFEEDGELAWRFRNFVQLKGRLASATSWSPIQSLSSHSTKHHSNAAMAWPFGEILSASRCHSQRASR